MMNVAPATLNIAGKPVRGVVVTCKCGVIKSLPLNSSHHSRPQSWLDNVVKRKLEAAGWKTLKAKDGPVCPSCVSAAGVKGAKGPAFSSGNAFDKIAAGLNEAIDVARCTAEPSKLHVIEVRPEDQAKPIPIKDFKDLDILTPKPPELTKENRRAILAKLEDVYVDETTGYSAGWTDAKVAADLGVPRAWVTTLRSENFGPEGNEEIKIALAEAKELMAAINKAMCAFGEQNRIIDEFERRAEKIERTIIEIEKGLRA